MLEELKGSREVAAERGLTIDALHDWCRRGRIVPEPAIVAGRRLWSADSIAALDRMLREQDAGMARSEEVVK